MTSPFENVIDLQRIYSEIIFMGKWHEEFLLDSYSSCAFPSEVQSGSYKLFSNKLNKIHSSSFNKEI